MRCKYESFGCYYESIHSSPPSGSSAIRGGMIVYCEKVDFLVSEVILFYYLCFFYLTYIQWLTPNSSLPVPCASFTFFFSFQRSIPPFVPLPLIMLSHLHAFFSPVSLPTCSAELCPVPCGSHGVCSEGQCQCEEGWIGAACDQRACHPRCEEHGQCHDGTCICQPGWEGEHCNIGELHVCMGECLIIPCDILISMINITKKNGVSVIGLFSIYKCRLLPNTHFFLHTVTHDLDVVVKGNLSLFRI